MNETKAERLKKVKTDLEEIQDKVSELVVLCNKIVEASRTHRIPTSQYKIKFFKRGDLN